MPQQSEQNAAFRQRLEELLQNTHLLYAAFANRLSALAGWIKQEKEKSSKTLYTHIPTPKNP